MPEDCTAILRKKYEWIGKEQVGRGTKDSVHKKAVTDRF
jgi:hypothetical protein